MSTEQPAPPLDYSAENVALALEQHAPRLIPGATKQLIKILVDEMKGLSLAQTYELVGARLGSENYRLFLRPDPAPPIAPPAAPPMIRPTVASPAGEPAGIPVTVEAIATEAAALGLPATPPHARQVAQLRVSAAARHGDSVSGGLSGR